MSAAPTANAACASVGGWFSVGDGSCKATGHGSFAFTLSPRSTSVAEGAGSKATAIGLNDTASATGGDNNFAVELGIGNTASTAFGNGNKNTATGLGNTAATVGTPGVDLTRVVGVEALDGTAAAYSKTVVQATATGNDNTNNGIGVGNAAVTALGSRNTNAAAGALNQALTVGTPSIEAENTVGLETYLLSGLGSTSTLSYTKATVDGTGNDNKNYGLGLAITAFTLLGSNNTNTAAGVGNRAATVGTPGASVYQQVDTTATTTGVSDTTVSAKGNDKTSTAP